MPRNVTDAEDDLNRYGELPEDDDDDFAYDDTFDDFNEDHDFEDDPDYDDEELEELDGNYSYIDHSDFEED